MRLGQHVPAHTNDAPGNNGAARSGKRSKQKREKTQTGLGVKRHGGKMIWTGVPNARQARADVCAGGSREQWGCMKF